jgi:hypothetical protein
VRSGSRLRFFQPASWLRRLSTEELGGRRWAPSPRPLVPAAVPVPSPAPSPTPLSRELRDFVNCRGLRPPLVVFRGSRLCLSPVPAPSQPLFLALGCMTREQMYRVPRQRANSKGRSRKSLYPWARTGQRRDLFNVAARISTSPVRAAHSAPRLLGRPRPYSGTPSGRSKRSTNAATRDPTRDRYSTRHWRAAIVPSATLSSIPE